MDFMIFISSKFQTIISSRPLNHKREN